MRLRRGQVALYLVMVLVAIMILALGNVGAFLAVRAKNRAMNAGDAAALAAARRQGELLNEIGRLNLEHAVADARGDYGRSLEIIREQKRLCFLGPLDCLRAANEAARANGAKVSGSMTSLLRRHVGDIREKYMTNPDLYPEPWEGAWEEYAAELAALANAGIVAGCDNMEFVDAVACFPLTAKSFYAMVEGASWCKLVVAGWTGLLDRDSHNMPRPETSETAVVVNSEICSLHLQIRTLEPMTPEEQVAFRALLAKNGAAFPPEEEMKDDIRAPDDPSRAYFFYDLEREEGQTPNALIAKNRLPLVGTFRPEYDVRGCASVMRVIEDVPQLLADSTRHGAWNAAAKPFGTIETSNGRARVTDEEARGLVLPAYEAVRLVPLAVADGQDLSTADEPWLRHVREHVPAYLQNGAEAVSGGCRYCRSLAKWEDPEFRSRIAQWIAENGETCVRPTGPGPDHGGTSYAH